MAHKLDGDRFDLVRWGVRIGVAFEKELELPIELTVTVKTGV